MSEDALSESLGTLSATPTALPPWQILTPGFDMWHSQYLARLSSTKFVGT